MEGRTWFDTLKAKGQSESLAIATSYVVHIHYHRIDSEHFFAPQLGCRATPERLSDWVQDVSFG